MFDAKGRSAQSEFITGPDAAAEYGVSAVQLHKFDRLGWVRAVTHPLTNQRLFLRSDVKALKEKLGYLTAGAS